MKVMVIGASGQLGTDMCIALRGFELVPFTKRDIEITDMTSVKEACSKHEPDVIINTAAYLRVDDCEDDPDKAFLVNALGARNIAVAAHEIGARLVHISTDQVFGGETTPGNVPFTEFDNPSPANVYSKSKLAGELLVQQFCLRHFVIRTGALFGAAGSSGKGGNFVETIVRLATERSQLEVVNDWIMSPAYAKDLAEKIAQLITTNYYGIFHITNKGACSWYEFSTEILKLAGINTPVNPITTEQYPQKARRPHYSVLSNYHLKLLGMDDMRPWQDALRHYMIEKGHLK